MVSSSKHKKWHQRNLEASVKTITLMRSSSFIRSRTGAAYSCSSTAPNIQKKGQEQSNTPQKGIIFHSKRSIRANKLCIKIHRGIKYWQSPTNTGMKNVTLNNSLWNSIHFNRKDEYYRGELGKIHNMNRTKTTEAWIIQK